MNPIRFLDRFAPGLFFAVIGAACLVAIKFHSSRSLTNPNDPGPWLMPTLLGSLLLVGGVALILGRVFDRHDRGTTDPTSVTGMNWQPWLLLGGIVLYVVLLPWIGFLLATPAFLFVMLWRMKIVWGKAAMAALILTAVGHLVFVWGFKTPLPAAYWN